MKLIGEVEELVNIKEPHPFALLSSPQSTMGKPCFLSLNPRPDFSTNIKSLKIKILNNLLNIIITVVIIDKPTLHSKPSMVHNPLPERGSLVPHHSTRTQLILPSIPLLNSTTTRATNSSHGRHKGTNRSLIRIAPYALRQHTPHNFLSHRNRSRGKQKRIVLVETLQPEMAPDPGRIRDLVGSEIQPLHEHHNGVSVEGRLVRHPVPRLSRLVHQNAQIPATHLAALPQVDGLGAATGGVVRLGKWAPNDGSRLVIAVRGQNRSNLNVEERFR
ncbi:hypothetical protein CR513_17384, partial [Mucuna pruriens]